MRRQQTEDQLWEAYRSNKSQKNLNALIEHYQPYVRTVAEAVRFNLPSHVDIDDLISEGQFGLISAIERYEDRGFKFKTYASLRIRGQIIDKLRVSDWAPRSLRTSLKEIDAAEDALTRELQREPTESEIADRLNLDLEELSEIRGRGNRVLLGHLDEVVASEGETVKVSDLIADANQEIDNEDYDPIKDRMVGALGELSDSESKIFVLHYVYGISMKEIAASLGVTESRVSQMHIRALDRMAKRCAQIS